MPGTDIVNMILSENKDMSMTDILEELYWSDLNEISHEDMVDIVIPYVLNSGTLEEVAGAIKLYENPDGAHIELFQDMIIKLYGQDPLAYIDTVSEYPQEGFDTLYIFRNNGYFKDFEKEKEILVSMADGDGTISKIELFFKMYDNLCHT